MQAALQPTSAAPRRRAAATKPVSSSEKKPVPKAKKTSAAIESIAAAYLTVFKTLPDAAKQRVMEMIEDYEDELDDARLAADIAANPEAYDLENAVPWEQVKAEIAAQTEQEAAAAQKQAA